VKTLAFLTWTDTRGRAPLHISAYGAGKQNKRTKTTALAEVISEPELPNRKETKGARVFEFYLRGGRV